MSLFRTVDLETTGLPSEDGTGPATGIMEIGWCDFTEGESIERPHSLLVDCGIPVSIEARAVHHISDDMVAGELNPTEACSLLAAGEHAYLVAHNVDHEKKYIGPGVRQSDQLERKWICTYKTALRIWTDAPGHKLQELRYFLKLDDEPDFDERLAMPPHRAAADAYVTAHLLRRVLKEVTMEQAIRWSSGPALLYMCFMKKHKGKPWHQVASEDLDYLKWIYEKSDVKDRDILATCKYYIKRAAGAQS